MTDDGKPQLSPVIPGKECRNKEALCSPGFNIYAGVADPGGRCTLRWGGGFSCLNEV